MIVAKQFIHNDTLFDSKRTLGSIDHGKLPYTQDTHAAQILSTHLYGADGANDVTHYLSGTHIGESGL